MMEMLYRELFAQMIDNKASSLVEVIVEGDAGKITTGAKRNILLSKAKGLYTVFIDDDDWVPPYYIEELLKASESRADCFAINGTITTNGGNEKKWYISKDNPYCASKDGHGNEIYLRYPNHITPIKRKIATQVQFPDITRGEDYIWATEIHDRGLIKTEYTIERPMYEYRFIENK